MGLRDFFKKLLNGRKTKRIADSMDIVEPGDGDEKDVKSIAYYKSCLRNNRSEINRITRYVNEYSEKFEHIKRQFPEGSKEYENAKEEMYRWIVALDRHKSETEFFRANTQEDIDYREEQILNFPDKLKEVLSPNFDLRFHSTSIGFAKQIIQSKQITSTPDRYDGYIKNSDGIGEISVSNRDDINRTIRYYSCLSQYSQALPAGCVFALLPKDKKDAANYKRSVIASVDFRHNPEQLFGIFTTPENIERVKGWMKESELNPNLVYTYEEFLEAVKIKSEIEDKNVSLRKRLEIKELPEQQFIDNVNSDKNNNLNQDCNEKDDGYTL